MRALYLACLAAFFSPPVLAQETAPGSTVPLPPAEEVVPLYPDPGLPRQPVAEDPEVPSEQVVAGLSNAQVSITARFDGSDIFIYGAVKRETPIPPGPPLDVIITVEAPSEQQTVWKKERRLGIWMNTQRVRIGAAPGFYSVVTSQPLDKILTPQMDALYRISPPYVLRAFTDRPDVEDSVPFTEALIRLNTEHGLYRVDQGGANIVEQTLFRADVRLPANLVEGEYKTRIFLIRDQQVVDVYRAPIEVRKVGLERWLYRLAFDQPLIYGIMSLAVAVIAGWGASAAFRHLRRS